MTDPIADMLTRIRNAIRANKEKVEVPLSNTKKAIAELLLTEGYVSAVEVTDEGFKSKIVITLKWLGKGNSAIHCLKRISKPGLRTYTNVEDMPRVLNGLGIAVVSTNKGILTDRQAKEKNVGGEVLCHVW